MKRFLILSISLLFFSLGCSDQDDELTGIKIRVKNASTITFDEVQVGGEEMIHSNLAPDDYSDYLIYESAYRYAYIRITSGEESYFLQPIDFVGETPLPLGFYTYELGITEEGDVILDFVID